MTMIRGKRITAMHILRYGKMQASWRPLMQYSPDAIQVQPTVKLPFQGKVVPNMHRSRHIMWQRIHLVLWWEVGRFFVARYAAQTPFHFRHQVQHLRQRILLITSRIEFQLITTGLTYEIYWNQSTLSSRIHKAAHKLA